MASRTDKQQKLWEKAKAMHGLGKSLREIAAETGLNYRAIGREAEAQGWVKGSLSQHIEDTARLKLQFVTLTETEQEIVRDLVANRIAYKNLIEGFAILNARDSMTADCGGQKDYKLRAEMLKITKDAVFGSGEKKEDDFKPIKEIILRGV